MTLIETIDRLEKLINNRAPTMEIRQVLFAMREQVEAIDKDATAIATLNESHANQLKDLQAQNQALVAENAQLKNPPPKSRSSQKRIQGRMET